MAAKMQINVPQGNNSFCHDADNCGGGAFVDLNNSSSFKTLPFAKISPQWRIVYKGLNVEGMCSNVLCEARGQRVICPKGFVVFNLNDPKGSHCPVCNELVKATTCSFSDCLWMFEGRKALTSLPSKFAPDVVSPWYTAENRYEFFDVTNNIVGWASLVIVAKKRVMPAETRPKVSQTSFVKSFFKRLSTCFSRSAIRMDEPCPICFGEQDEMRSMHRTSCGHVFHEDCVNLWKASGGTSCPMCREHLLEFA